LTVPFHSNDTPQAIPALPRVMVLQLKFQQFNGSGQTTGTARSYEIATPENATDLEAFLKFEVNRYQRDGVVVLEAHLLRVNSDEPALSMFVDMTVLDI